MPVNKSLVLATRVVMCALATSGTLVACGSGRHEPVDTSKIFKIESTLGEGFKTVTKGPSDINPKMLGPEKFPPGVKFDPEDCRDHVTTGRLPKGTRGRMSVLATEGQGNRFTVTAVQSNESVPFDAEAVKKCGHVTFEAGKITGYIDEVDAPQINGAETTGSHRQIEATVGDKQASTEAYTFSAYLGDLVVFVTAGSRQAKGQPPAPIDTDRARQLLTDSVAALR